MATHLLPLTTALVAVPIGYWAGRELFDRRAGLAAAGLFATNPFLGWYSTETRMYPSLVVLGIVGLTLAVRAVRGHRWQDIAGAVSPTPPSCTPTTGASTSSASPSWCWGAWRRRGTGGWPGVVAGAAGAVVVLWLPWVPSLIEQAGSTAAPWAIRPQVGDFFADPPPRSAGTLGVVVAPLLGHRRGSDPAAPARRDADGPALLCAIGVLTALAGWLAAQIEPSWTVRYLAVVGGPPAAGRRRRPRRRAVPVAGS